MKGNKKMKNNTIPKEIVEARKQYKSITVHCPHMKNMQPFPELLNEKCVNGKNGKCGSCDKFAGLWSEEGRISSYGSYEGFCDCK